jgi:hypothetical protein
MTGQTKWVLPLAETKAVSDMEPFYLFSAVLLRRVIGKCTFGGILGITLKDIPEGPGIYKGRLYPPKDRRDIRSFQQ